VPPGSEIHIWTIRLEAPPDLVSYSYSVLSQDERDRIANYRFEHLRLIHTLARGSLRFLLSSYTEIPPAEIGFLYSAKGKPSMKDGGPLQFNVSHSGNLAVFAFATSGELGVDVEQIRSIPDLEQIAANCFCGEEAAELMSLAPEERRRAFFVCWTRKEAFLKATGDGLSTPLDSFRVSLLEHEPVRLIHPGGWTLQHIDPAPGAVGAVAYHGAPQALCIHSLISAGMVARSRRPLG
jgi:4'-phosphopantetheinyl transferase